MSRHAGRCHGFGGQDEIELCVRHQPTLAHQIADRAPGLHGELGDLGCLSVPDVRAERCSQRRAAIEELATALDVDGDSRHARLIEHAHRPPEDRGRVQGIPGDDGHHHVQFELARVGSRQNRRIASKHLVAHLVDHFRDRGVDLAGHD